MRMRACMGCTRRSYKIGLRNRTKGTVTIAIADRYRSGRNEINALRERTSLRPGLGAA
jgi:hypothetical protein